MKTQKYKKIIVFVSIFFIWFIAHILIVTFDGLKDELDFSDVAVVLGNKVELSGEPSERLKGRLNKTIELYEKGYFEHIIVSGGIGKEGYDEAEVMKIYLVEKGIQEDKILVDSVGYNSLMTAQNAKSIMNTMNFDSITIITQFYHISRTKLAFKKMDIENVQSAHADYFELRDIYSLVREFIAYYKYLFI
jgi:vancomycin permeability regulator SanA